MHLWNWICHFLSIVDFDGRRCRCVTVLFCLADRDDAENGSTLENVRKWRRTLSNHNRMCLAQGGITTLAATAANPTSDIRSLTFRRWRKRERIEFKILISQGSIVDPFRIWKFNSTFDLWDDYFCCWSDARRYHNIWIVLYSLFFGQLSFLVGHADRRPVECVLMEATDSHRWNSHCCRLSS